jgi:hypothetical protein
MNGKADYYWSAFFVRLRLIVLIDIAMMKKLSALFIVFGFQLVQAQKTKDPVFVDKQGILRYTGNNTEAAFFGVNYTVPFAYGYRSHKALNADLEKAIDADVYHLARLGLDAFRVHVWDVEISDSAGNLLENEHLRLFDYLVKKLKDRNIKILVTPIAFWGNGYPQKDEKTIGFSSVYGKRNAVVLEAAIKAQENYLQQFFKHINPYTKLSYKDDPDVIAMEINNEPQHSGPKEKVTEYVNRLAAAVKATGWTKPIFYNISESPSYADAVAKSEVDGFSFQWYPTGLVAGHEQKGNFLPNTDRYFIPFTDTIPQFSNRARMVYEFDAGDVLQSNMYPAMARSFRTAGFQWATQFAYDPMATAYANTEYQTHYLNLACTPSKAISLLIASRAFHKLPRWKGYGSFPADTLFDVFRVSYKNNLSEMSTEEEFYYSNSTTTQPKKLSTLKHIAGVGHSAVVEYEGSGAYFLDQLAEGVWRLELMPDAIHIHDPFEKASPGKEVTKILWQKSRMQIMLKDLQTNFEVRGINEGNSYHTTAAGTGFIIWPGTYLLTGKNSEKKSGWPKKKGAIGLNEYFAPPPSASSPLMVHQPLTEVSASKSFTISARVIAADAATRIFAELHNSSNQWKTIELQTTGACHYKAEVPADIVSPGLISYRIMIQKGDTAFYTFPGAYKGDPYAWDNINVKYWNSFVAAAETPLVLFDATTDRDRLMIYNSDWRNNAIEYVIADKPGQLVMKAAMNKNSAGAMLGWQLYLKDKLKGRSPEFSSFKNMVVRARSNSSAPQPLRLSLISDDAHAFSTTIQLTGAFKEYTIPLAALQKDSSLLLPRPYPSFQPLWFRPNGASQPDLNHLDKLEISFKNEEENKLQASPGIQIERVWLTK